MNFQLIDLPEIGLKSLLPFNWIISYNTDYDIIHLSNKDGTAGVVIFRNYDSSLDKELIKLVLNEINCTAFKSISSDLSQETTCLKGELKIKLRLSDFFGAKIIYYLPINDEANLGTINKVINSLKISKPSHGIYEDRVRFNEENYRWSVTLPKTWRIKPYGLFNLGFIAKTGTIITWLTFYPLIDEDFIDEFLKRRYKIILASISKATLINIAKEDSSIKIDFSRNGIDYKFYLNLQTHNIVIGKSSIKFIAEAGYIVPKFMEYSIIDLIDEIFSSFSFGPNFLSDLGKLKRYEHCIFSLGILSRFIGKNLNEIFDKYLVVIDNEIITTLSKEIKESFTK